MDKATFNTLLNHVRGIIYKNNTKLREAISEQKRLIATLRFLVTGRSYEDLKFSCAISPQLLGRIIPETCVAVFEELKTEYLKFPTSSADWMNIAQDFKTLWQIENCLGSMDGKFIEINKQNDSGAYFYNYEGFFSVVLFAMVNAQYELIYIHCGTNGRISDGGILQETDVYDMFGNNSLNIPFPGSFTGCRNVTLPFTLVAKKKKTISHDEKIFIYRISRARRVVENTFGIMCSRFRCLLTCLGMHVGKVDSIVLACFVLHKKEKS
ncbi:hypothetical protein PR048_003712 [Dryococelus australis]|uniref:DDE Tnp4 domain-containing protein n=1 Tax=Dryococelus australis TaxID=614101 RepID=A0ABQ9INZ1_9NEOP|nr:hypothetical protein PR048_003712 [Dryococelus australis]